MIRYKDIEDKLLHLVGWEQHSNPRNSIDRDVTRSESGLYFTDAHPLLTLDNMNSVMPLDYIYSYKGWNRFDRFKKGDKVVYNGVVWVAKIDNLGEEPTASDFNNDFSKDDYGNPFWKPYNHFSDYLVSITKSGVKKAIQRFVADKTIGIETKSIIEDKYLFDGAGRYKNTIENKGRLVGFELMPLRSNSVTINFNKVALQVYGGNCKVDLYIFHSSQIEPIHTIQIDCKGNGSVTWLDLDNVIMSYSEFVGGSYYLCYHQNDLGVDKYAVNYSRDWSVEPCGTCNNGNLEDWRNLIKYVQPSPFYVNVDSDFKDNPILFDLEDVIYTPSSNYGLNFNVTIGCDLTDFIVKQRSIFANVVQLQVAEIALRTIALNPSVNVNRNQSNSRTEILYELDGSDDAKRGLNHDLDNAFKSINLDTKGIDRVCLSCNNWGVKYGSI